MKLFSNEIVFRGHPDKVCDQISDALLDAYLKGDRFTRAGIECVGGKGKIFVTGEVTSSTKVDVVAVVKRVLKDVGYEQNDYEIIDNIGKQSADISQGVDVGGAGDQGMTFGYACDDTDKLLPKAMVILQELSMFYDSLVTVEHTSDFLADGKAQITGYYDEDFRLVKIKYFTISYQNTEKHREITDSILITKALEICSKYGIEVEKFYINPTGRFCVGGYQGDSGLTGRKIVVDSYQAFAPVGGGCFSGKDPTKVDRSGAYMARLLARQMLTEKHLKWCQIQLSYAIGVAEPLAIYIDSDKGFIEPPSDWYTACTPANMIKRLQLQESIYEKTAQFGHIGNPAFMWEK